jgi:hypothetical protein
MLMSASSSENHAAVHVRGAALAKHAAPITGAKADRPADGDEVMEAVGY